MIDKAHAASIQSIMSQIRQFETQTKGSLKPELSLTEASPSQSVAGKGKTDFAQLVKGAVESVNGLQQNAQSLATSFEQGQDVPLTDVVLAMQKSSIAFEATLQIRNKVMKAYEDIKNMPV